MRNSQFFARNSLYCYCGFALIFMVAFVTTTLGSSTSAQNLKNEQQTAQQKSPKIRSNPQSQIMMETLEPERIKKLVAFEVAEEAKKIIMQWVVWLGAPIVIALLIWQWKTWNDFKRDVRNFLNTEIDKIKNEAERITTEAIEDIATTSALKVEKLDREIELVKSEVSLISEEAKTYIKQSVTEFVSTIPPGFGRAKIKDLHRMVYDAEHKYILPGKLVRSEGDSPTQDTVINELYDMVGIAYRFFLDVFNRNSFDDRGSEIIVTAHYGESYNNAFWNGKQLVFGDGDGEIFQKFIGLDIVVSQFCSPMILAKIDFFGETGALHFHLMDIFGSLAVQWHHNQTVENADWLIGKDILGPSMRGQALRNIREPGTAFNNSLLGKDPQPAHMKDYYQGPRDNQGIHINGGIPNKAFYLVASKLGGYAWEKAGKIWYESLLRIQNRQCPFLEFAEETYQVAGSKYGIDSSEQQAVRDGWKDVGVLCTEKNINSNPH